MTTRDPGGAPKSFRIFSYPSFLVPTVLGHAARRNEEGDQTEWGAAKQSFKRIESALHTERGDPRVTPSHPQQGQIFFYAVLAGVVAAQILQDFFMSLSDWPRGEFSSKTIFPSPAQPPGVVFPPWYSGEARDLIGILPSGLRSY